MPTTVFSTSALAYAQQPSNSTLALGYARPFTTAASVSQSTTATGTGTSMVSTAFSATPTSGDMLVAVISRVDNNATSANPAGWTQLTAGGTASSRRMEVWYYRSTGVIGDRGAFTFATAAGANRWSIQMFHFAGSGQRIQLIQAATSFASSATPAAITYGPGFDNAPLLLCNVISITGAANTVTGAFSGTATAESHTVYTDATYGCNGVGVSDQYNNADWLSTQPTYGTAFTLATARAGHQAAFAISSGGALSQNPFAVTGGAGVVGSSYATAISESVLSFDTSSLGSSASIVSATLKIVASNAISIVSPTTAVPANATLQARFYGTTAPINTRGYNNNHWWFGSAAASAQTLLATYGPSVWVNTTAYDMVSTAAMLTSINKTGNTHISLVTDDIVNSTNRVTEEMYAHALTGNTLTVVSIIASSATVTTSVVASAAAPTRNVGYLRTIPTVSVTSTAAAPSRIVSYLRSITTNIAAVPVVSRALGLLRTITTSVDNVTAVSGINPNTNATGRWYEGSGGIRQIDGAGRTTATVDGAGGIKQIEGGQ